MKFKGDAGHMDYNTESNTSGTIWEQRVDRDNTGAIYRYNPGRTSHMVTLQTKGLPVINPNRFVKYGEERYYLTDPNTGRVMKIEGPTIDQRIEEAIPVVNSSIIEDQITPEQDIFIFPGGFTKVITTPVQKETPRKSKKPTIPEKKVEVSKQAIPTHPNDNTSTSGSKTPGNIRQGNYPIHESLPVPDGYAPSNEWIEERDQVNGQVRITWRNKKTGEIRRVRPYKQGGTMSRINYFENGGQTQNQQAQAQAFMKALLQGDPAAAQQLVQSAMQKDEASAKLIQNILEAEQQGNTRVSKAAQAIRQVMQQMQGQAISAKWGSKLGYIRSLKYAKGGKTCPACEKGAPIKVEEKACGGKAKKAKKRYFGGWL